MIVCQENCQNKHEDGRNLHKTSKIGKKVEIYVHFVSFFRLVSMTRLFPPVLTPRVILAALHAECFTSAVACCTLAHCQ
jgi:hypothetical protein